MLDNLVFAKQRLLLYYKGHISALILFAQQENGSVCFPNALPRLSMPLAEDESLAATLFIHPATLLHKINQLYQFDISLLSVEPGYTQQIDAPGGVITVHMAHFNLLDPPHKFLQSYGFTLKTLPELRNRPPAELELLRRAYVKLMEG